jgi:DNA-directed RNA polymerase specialized sigma24 family protein
MKPPTRKPFPTSTPPDLGTLAGTLDELVFLASRGHRRAIDELARSQNKTLLAEARDALGRSYRQEAGEVVQAFYLSLLEGKNRFLPEENEAAKWMTAIVRAIAQTYRK